MQPAPGTAAALLDFEISQLGVQEEPPLSNDIPYWCDLGLCSWNGEAWCAAFQTFSMIRAGVPFPDLGIPGGFVYCPDAVQWAEAHGDLITSVTNVLPGDLVFFSWDMNGVADHVGLVEFVDSGGAVHTIEGNTSLPNGNDGVARCVHTTDMLGFVRPGFLSAGAPPAHKPNPVPIANPTMRGNMLCSSPTGKGGWSCGPDGGVFPFGGAEFYGSLPGLHVLPNRPIVAIIPNRTGKGYWLIGADGGVFSFGDAKFLGSLPTRPDFHAGGDTDPCIGGAWWEGNSTLNGGLGYVLATRPLGSREPLYYEFDGDGRYANAA
jgi:hypothetical protein